MQPMFPNWMCKSGASFIPLYHATFAKNITSLFGTDNLDQMISLMCSCVWSWVIPGYGPRGTWDITTAKHERSKHHCANVFSWELHVSLFTWLDLKRVGHWRAGLAFIWLETMMSGKLLAQKNWIWSSQRVAGRPIRLRVLHNNPLSTFGRDAVHAWWRPRNTLQMQSSLQNEVFQPTIPQSMV